MTDLLSEALESQRDLTEGMAPNGVDVIFAQEKAAGYMAMPNPDLVDYRDVLKVIDARERSLSVYVNGKTISVDDVTYATEILFQQRHMHSMVTVLGVGMQQDPNDAIASADLLWRVRPRLLIELGTSGGGSALFYARVMRGYDPEARVLTMDPAIDTVPLQNWNHVEMRNFCSHCQPASATRTWKASVAKFLGTP